MIWRHVHVGRGRGNHRLLHSPVYPWRPYEQTATGGPRHRRNRLQENCRRLEAPPPPVLLRTEQWARPANKTTGDGRPSVAHTAKRGREMGTVLGKIGVETAKFEVVHSGPDYEIRRYAPAVVAEVSYDPAQMRGDRDGGFMVLAEYIGAVGKPQNTRPEKIAMTAPVITSAAAGEKIAMTAPVITSAAAGEKIAMTAPVITSAAAGEKIAMTAPVITSAAAGEKIAMTAPVITSAAGGEEIAMTAPVITAGGEAAVVTMQFVLPSKYAKAEEAPAPVDKRVVIREEGEKTYAVVKFSGVATEKAVAQRVEKLRQSLERDGRTVTGGHMLARYNPPWTLPPFRTNEVLLPIQ